MEPTEECFRRHLALGVYPIPYVTLYQAPMGWTFQGINLREHPEFIEINEKGSWKPTGFWDSEDAKNWYILCPAVEGLQEALVKHVIHLMEMGAAGIFIDNLGRGRKCFGSKHGLHTHLSEDLQEAFEMLLKKVYAAVKSFGEDKVVIGNPGSIEAMDPKLWRYLDAGMKESYICTWVAKDRLLGGTWQEWYDRDVKCRPLTHAGKKIWALSYLGHTPNLVKDDAYYCYATARLHNFIWSAGGNELAGDPSERLLGLRLGQPLDEDKEAGGIHYRLYENGLVAVNPSDSLKTLEISYPKSVEAIYNLYEERSLPLEGGTLRIELPAQSGRVYVNSVRYRNVTNWENKHFLLVETDPPLGNINFKVDGIPFWTHAGRWTTKYEKGEQFGKFLMGFTRPGRHVIEVIDEEAKPMQTTAGYSTREKLGKFMDPARPTEPMKPDQAYRFVGWKGAFSSVERRITLHTPHEKEEKLQIGKINILYIEPGTPVTRLIAEFKLIPRR